MVKLVVNIWKRTLNDPLPYSVRHIGWLTDSLHNLDENSVYVKSEQYTASILLKLVNNLDKKFVNSFTPETLLSLCKIVWRKNR